MACSSAQARGSMAFTAVDTMAAAITVADCTVAATIAAATIMARLGAEGSIAASTARVSAEAVNSTAADFTGGVAEASTAADMLEADSTAAAVTKVFLCSSSVSEDR